MTKKLNKKTKSKTKPKSANNILANWQWLPLLAGLLLLIATALQSWWGAGVHSTNADQLINSRLLESANTFKQASWPGQHTFLFKLPLLWLVAGLGLKAVHYKIVTTIVCCLTVASFAYLLYRINRRPFVLTALYLGLASMLLLTPPAPYSGGILPVNMAMLTTRNLEYILYIAIVYGVIKSTSLRSFWPVATTLLLAILLASDKLFLGLSLGGSVIALIIGFLPSKTKIGDPKNKNLAMRWFIITVLAWLGSEVILRLINALHITNIVMSQTPYSFIKSLRSLVLGTFFGITGLATNFGANPAFDALTFKSMPSLAFGHLKSAAGPGLLINIGLLVALVYAAWKFLQQEFWRQDSQTTKKSKRRLPHSDRPVLLTKMLVFSSVAGLGSFVLTDHYHPVDARYLTIALFTLFVLASTQLRNKSKVVFNDQYIKFACLVLAVSMPFSIWGARQIAWAQNQALTDINARNAAIASIMKQRDYKTLVGDYWRVVPTKHINPELQIVPLSDCTNPRGVLNSGAWQPDLSKTSFAYLVSLEKGLTDFPKCSLDTIQKHFGQPDSNVLVSGTLDKPKEMLLFYADGMHALPEGVVLKPNNTEDAILPKKSSDLEERSCANNSLVQVVAHQDDDLLFMSPDLLHSLNSHKCITTIYITAGDSGADAFYWLGREKGSQSAYNAMMGKPKQHWDENTVKLESGLFVNLTNPDNNPTVSLIFVRMPDGNPRGEGFKKSHFASISKLNRGAVPTVTTVDKQSTVSKDQLVSSLKELFELFEPSEIRTQSTAHGPYGMFEHSDHIATGRIAQTAFEAYKKALPARATVPTIAFYQDYSAMLSPPNVEGADLAAKDQAFSAYAEHDPAVCTSRATCWKTSNYSHYLPRQYRVAE